MKKLNIITLVILSVSLCACGNTTKKEETEPEVVTVDTQQKETYEAASTEVEFNDPKIATAYQEYINLKTALVNTDAQKTAKVAMELMTAFANLGVSDEAMTAAQTMAESGDVEAQRKAFVVVTEAVEQMLEGAITSGAVYKQYCPMAFDFEGAFWLSNSKEIYNPYFGDKMLHCGKVDSEIK